MKKMFEGLGDFLVGLAKLILICGAVVLLVRGLDWVFEKTLPLKAIGIPPIALSITVLCLIVWIVMSVVEKRIWKSPVKTMTRHEIHEARANSNRGWLCLMTGFWVWMMTLDMDNTREKLILCAIAAIVAWPVTIVKKIKERPGLCALVLLAVWLICGGTILVWDGMTHVGSGMWTFGGDEPGTGGQLGTDEHSEMIPQGEYRRQCFVSGIVIFLVAGGIFWGVIKTWKEKNEKDKLEKSWASSKAGNFGLSFDSWNTLMDVIKEIELKNDITPTDRIKSGIAKFKQQYPGEKFDEAGVAEFLTGGL